MRTTLLAFSLLGTTLQAQVTHTLVASDFQFQPDLLTITSGDTVHLILGAGHSFTEVSAGTWNLNQGAPQIGIELGVFPNLTEHDIVLTMTDTLYYVCVPHVSMGMKGRIAVVAGSIGLDEAGAARMRIYPNPASEVLRISDAGPGAASVRFLDAFGRIALDTHLGAGTVDVRSLPPAAYIVQVINAQGAVLQKDVVMVQH